MQYVRGDQGAMSACAEPASAWPVDIVHLSRYTLGDKSLEREVLGLFAAEARQRIDAFTRARSEKEWQMAAHTLKGSSRAVGAWRVAHLAQEAERLCIEDSDACASAIRLIEEAAAEASAYIARLYPVGQSAA
jgi:FOG: HPt domain